MIPMAGAPAAERRRAAPAPAAAAPAGSVRTADFHHPRPTAAAQRRPSQPLASNTAAHSAPSASLRTPAAARPPPRPPAALDPPKVMTSFPAHLHQDVLSNGLLLIDKPPHWEVAEVVTAVQRATRAHKIASVAPLDAAASGLMLLCFGAATRLSRRVEGAAKRYEGSLVLGASAAAVDVRGGSYVAEALPWGHISDEELQEAADALRTVGVPDGARSAAEAGGGLVDVDDDDDEDDGDGDRGADGSAGDGGGAAGSGDVSVSSGGSGGSATVQVLPPRYRLRQYPSSFKYYEEDSGVSFTTLPLRVHDFKVWRASGEEVSRGAAAAAAAAAAAGARLPAAAGGAAAGLQLGPSAFVPGAGDVEALMGRVVRFSVLLSGRAHLRSLVDMYGRRLRTCACLDELRRTEVGTFAVGDAWPLEAVLPILMRYKR